MTTERLYYDDTTTLTFSARILEETDHKGRPALILDRTYFYPEGGGQPSDQGTLNGALVIDVQTRPADRAVLHILAAPYQGEAFVEGAVDAVRRMDYRQHHSGQHILSRALELAANADTLSVHMSAESMTIDVNRIDITPAEWAAVEDLANRIVFENHPVRQWFPSPEELAALATRKMPAVEGKVRIVDIGGFDVTACGGTHVQRSGEIGLIKVIKAERRGATTRLEFRCGGRALRDYRTKNTALAQLTTRLTVGIPELDSAVERLQDENRLMRSALNAARDQQAAMEAETLYGKAHTIGTVRLVVGVYEEGERSVDEVRLLAQKVTAHEGALALVALAGEKCQVIVQRAEDVALDCVGLLKTALRVIGSTRGGGRPNAAQGGGVAATADQLRSAFGAVVSAIEAMYA